MNNSKYPREYTEGDLGFIKDPFRPEFRYDSRGRLVMPLPGYSKMMLSVEPGSRKIGQSTEDEAGNPQTDPGSIKTGYLHAQTALKVGPEGGWIVQLAGGDATYPISYFNETSEVTNFYVDKAGNVYIKGTIYVEGGDAFSKILDNLDDILDGATFEKVKGLALNDNGMVILDQVVEGTYSLILTTSITAGKIVLTGGAGVDGSLPTGYTDAKCTDALADQTSANPQLYAWITGSKPPVDADHTADIVSAMAYEDLVELSKLGTTIVQGGYLKTILIDAQYIQTGILTGRIVRTTSASTRVEINISQNALIVYQGGNERVAIGAGVVAFMNPSGIGSGEIYGLGTNQLGFNVSGGGDYYMNASEFGPQSTGVYGLGTSSLSFKNCFFGQTRARLLYPATHNLYNLGYDTIRWKDFYLEGILKLRTNAANVTGDLVPTTNDFYELGLSATQKWYKIWAHYQGIGDIEFDNKFRITEEEGVKKGLAVYNQRDEKIMILDEDGNLWLAGKLNPEILMKTRFPFYKKIFTKKELKQKVE